MSFEKISKKSAEEKESSLLEWPKETEELIISEPKLRYINKILELLRPEENNEGEKMRWTEIYKNVKSYENVVDLSDNINEVVRDWIAKKIPSLKNNIPFLRDIDDKNILSALLDGEFEEIGKEVMGSRREVLFAVAASVTKRIENCAYQKILKEADDIHLQKLYLTPSTRDLLIELLDTSVKANPLFVRFLAYAQLSGRPLKKASAVTLYMPGDKRPHTIAEFFPHESQSLAKRFSSIAEHPQEWVTLPGGNIFKAYMEQLSKLYNEKNPAQAEKHQEAAASLFNNLLESDFPIILTLSTEGYYKEPYYDPELKISLATPDTKKEEVDFKKTQKAMADSLEVLGVKKFQKNIQNSNIRVAHTIGAYGVNLVFNAVAQEKPEPTILMYLNLHMRSDEEKFPSDLALIKNIKEEFGDQTDIQKENYIEKMPRYMTILHELAHNVYPDNSKEAKRLGRRPLTVIDEVKAEIIHKALVPHIIEKGGVPGTKRQWSYALLAGSLPWLKEPKRSPYYAATVYFLNGLFNRDTIRFYGGMFEIKDFEAYEKTVQSLAKEVLALYEDKNMTEKKAERWIIKRCTPNAEVEKISPALQAKTKR
ncbi:MAG: hypothetical protein HY445_00415 [Candidatus Niyogibacteria bacterium]|nr:hypothetical protein [Candidatus Niyogibacteria bacterium]